jgi:hypothetical protein
VPKHKHSASTKVTTWTSDNSCLITDSLLQLGKKSKCDHEYFGICLVKPESTQSSSIFGFAEFVTALALLVVIYTTTDIRYRFRIAIAPISLFKLTYVLILLIGFGTLLIDLWFVEQWLLPSFLANKPILQAILGSIFLSLACVWLYYASINPPVFGKYNYKEFAAELFRIIFKGSDDELTVIAGELIRSTKSLVKLTRQNLWKPLKKEELKGSSKKDKLDVSEYAYDILLLIGHRKLCRHIVLSAPGTAIAFFEDMIEMRKLDIPIGQFIRNTATEAILNKDSILYHEDEGYYSGFMGYVKPFSKTIYGNYSLVEGLGNDSPLDIHHNVVWNWDADQFAAYSRVVLITLENYIETGNWHQHSFVLSRAFEKIIRSCRDLYKLNNMSSDYYATDIAKRLNVTVEFIGSAINLIEKKSPLPKPILLRQRKNSVNRVDIYDQLAHLMFEIIASASAVTSPRDTCWSIHYGAVWGDFFSLANQGDAWKVVHFKLRRLLYNGLTEYKEFLNVRSARVLGFCLNVMGLEINKSRSSDKGYYALHKVLLKWTAENFLILRNEILHIADACLIGSISFDAQNSRLVKTFANIQNREGAKQYLNLVKPPHN